MSTLKGHLYFGRNDQKFHNDLKARQKNSSNTDRFKPFKRG